LKNLLFFLLIFESERWKNEKEKQITRFLMGMVCFKFVKKSVVKSRVTHLGKNVTLFRMYLWDFFGFVEQVQILLFR
jgi:hypothetical protein